MRLKELRTKNKLTQQDIALRLNIARSTYNGYEQNFSEPNIETLSNLADYYNVSLDYLVGRDYNNEIGYLNEQQKNAVKIIQQLNQTNLIQAIAYMSGLLVNQ